MFFLIASKAMMIRGANELVLKFVSRVFKRIEKKISKIEAFKGYYMFNAEFASAKILLS